MSPGDRYGRYTLLMRREQPGKSHWLCRCDCGTEKLVRADHLISGRVKACGCLQLERASTANRTHGKTGTAEHAVWQGMWQRCTNPKTSSWSRYGGRGIGVCDQWKDFTVFLADMGVRPTPEHSIDRKDNDGDYEPGNCRWATASEQSLNRRPSDYRGERTVTAKLTESQALTILRSSEGPASIARKFGVTPALIYRIRHGRAWRHLSRDPLETKKAIEAAQRGQA